MGSFLTIGQRFQGRFDIVEPIARGGFSRIYLARQVELGRQVALKILSPPDPTSADPDRWRQWSRRFEREAKLVSRLKDPHTVTVYDYGRTDAGLGYIAFEFIDGQTVAQRRRRGPMAADKVVDILDQVLQSLAEAHQMGVLHRDIKPANLMLYTHLGRPDRVKVLDFGIAHDETVAADPTQADLTREGFILGTPRYMAPEQFRSDPLTPAADLYSLGLVVWEMLAGHQAISAAETVDIIGRQIDDTPISLPDQLDIPDRLAAIVNKMVAKSPDQRFQNADRLIDALDAATAKPAKPTDARKPATDHLDADHSDADHSDADHSDADAGQPGQQTPAGPKKPNKLEELGAQELVRRSGRRRDRSRRLRRWLWAAAVVAVAGLVGYWVWTKAGSVSAMPAAAKQMANARVVTPVKDLLAGDDPYSGRGIHLAIVSAGWSPVGKQSTVETPTEWRTQRSYRRDGQRIEATVRHCSQRKAAREIAGGVGAPSRALRLGTKVVIIDPSTTADTASVDALIAHLKRFREKVAAR